MTDQLRPKKKLGQNFLTDRNILERIARLVERNPDDRIMEIGPGRGALTRFLAAQGSRVLAVEVDRHLASLLAHEFSGNDKSRWSMSGIVWVRIPAKSTPNSRSLP